MLDLGAKFAFVNVFIGITERIIGNAGPLTSLNLIHN